MHLCVKNGVVWDDDTNAEVVVEFDWSRHALHLVETDGETVPMRHVLYTATKCPCGAILIDEEQ